MGVINVLNAEKFRKEILENSNVVFDFSMSKDKHTIKKCLGVCDDCFFHEAGDHCSNIKVKWFLSEYKEPIKLSRLEHELLKFIDNEGYKYIARDNCGGVLFRYPKKPTKNIYGEWGKGGICSDLRMFNDLFQFVKWEDEEPKSIKKILNNCEVSDGESE